MKYPYLETITEIQKFFIDKFNSSANIKYEYVPCPSCKTKKIFICMTMIDMI